MGLTTLQKTLKATEFQAILDNNPRLKKFHQEIQAQNAKIDAMIGRITNALEKGDDTAAFSEFPMGDKILEFSKTETPKSEIRQSIASKIRPFNS